ncbi:MAG: translation elongation factor Ts [Bacteroidales bacterium]|nr:translation elongation factor Ts [Bacteroidales bacterium]
MATITAQEVNKLRQITGAGMMDCKNALVEAEGNIDAAIDILRKKGQKVAAKRADREANQGAVIAKANADHTFGAVVLLSCETDFVAKNADFVAFTHKLVDVALANHPTSIETLLALPMEGRTVNDHVTDQVGKIGEKIEIAAYECIEAPVVASYIHTGNKLATLVGLNKTAPQAEEFGHDVAMQVAAMNPVAVDAENVPEDIVKREFDVAVETTKTDPKNARKSQEMIEKIAQGKMAKFYKENTLLSQEFIKNNKLTVGAYLKEADKDLTVTSFKRVQIGA